MVNFFKRFTRKEKILEEKSKDTPTTIILQQAPMGSSGTSIYSGYIYEDYLNEMTGTRRAETFDKIATSDYNAIMCLSAVTNPIKSATWEIVPGDDSEEAFQDAELIKHILFKDMEKPFDSFLTEALSFVPFGFSLFEIVHKVVINDPDFKNYIGIKNLCWRSQKTIEAWNIDKGTEELVSVLQVADGDSGKTVTMPAQFLLLFNSNAKGANFEGISWLRGAYGNWKRKNLYLKMNAAGIEKFSIPTPTVEVPAGKEDSPEYQMLVTVLQSYTSHQQNFLTYPAGWNVKLNANSGFDPSKIDYSIDSEDKRMTKSFLANFLELGMNGTGSYSLSNDLSDFFLGGLQHVGNEICKKINQKLIKDLIILNRGKRRVYPMLKVSNISDKAGKELAEILASTVNSKVIIPDDALEDHIRNRYNLPARTSDGQRFAQPNFGFSLSEKIANALKRKR